MSKWLEQLKKLDDEPVNDPHDKNHADKLRDHFNGLVNAFLQAGIERRSYRR